MSKISKVLLHIVAVFLTVCSGFSAEDTEPVPPDGYLPKSSYTDRLNETFHQDFGCIHVYEKKTEPQAAVDTWNAYDFWFEDQIVRNIQRKMKRLGLQELSPEQVDQLRNYLNPDRGSPTPRVPGEIIKWYSATDARHFIKFRLSTVSHCETVHGWIYSRYTTQVTADLDMGIWEYVGPARHDPSATAEDLDMERNLQEAAHRK